MQKELNPKGEWKKLDRPSDFINLNVGETIVVKYVKSEKSTVYEDNFIHTIDFDIDGDKKEYQEMAGKDLDNWFFNHPLIKEGSLLKITRTADKKLPNKPEPMKRYDVEIWDAL